MTMKRLMLVWVMVLCLAPLSCRAEGINDESVQLPCSKEGVAEFMVAFSKTVPNGIVNEYHEKEAKCFQVTPETVAQQTDIRIFKFSDSAASYAYVDGAVFDLCESTGGYGFLNAVPWDYDRDGHMDMDLLIASSWGSGLSRAEISVFNRTKRTSKLIYSTLYEDDPQVELIVCLDTALNDSAQASEPGVRLCRVQVQLLEDHNVAHLSCRMIGEYQPSFPLVLHETVWNADAASRLLGTWYSEIDELGVIYGIAMTFTDDGAVTLRLIDRASGQYEEESTAQYWVDENTLTMGSNEEISTTAFTVTDDELLLAIYGMEAMPFRKLSGEELAWVESLLPKYLPGDISQVTIDYGESEHFTHEQMDVAIAVIKEKFLGWYNCELHSIAYTTDERSAKEYQYYAGAESRKTGKNYVDGMVFVSSFHSAAEDMEYPGSGLNPDEEYTGWGWILLQTEEGPWELVTWGY